MRRIVQVREVKAYVFIFGQVPDGTVVLAPLEAHLLPRCYPLLNSVVLVSRAEHLTHIVGQRLLVSVAHTGQHIALEVRRTTLECRTRELLVDDLVQPGKTVCDHQTYALDTPFPKVIEHDAPAGGALYGTVIKAQHFARGILVHSEDNIERFRRRTLLTEHLDMDTVHEYDRIVLIQASLEPLRNVATHILYHPRYACLAIMFSIYLIEHLTNLRLGQPLGIQAAGKPLAFLFLILQNGQNLRMKVAETVSRYPELQLPAVAVCMPQTIAVPLVPVRLLVQKLATLRCCTGMS